MFSAESIRCERGGRVLFQDLGFALDASGLLLLTGQNGCGKTSLLRILAGLMQPAEGKILWQGKPIRGNESFADNMLFIGHQNALKPELSVYDNLQFWAALRGTEMLVPAALQFFRLTPMMNMPAGRLSAGWQRRVALARLLATPSHLWLLDEPSTNLDDEGQRLVEGLIETRIAQGGMVVLSSHHKPKLNVQNCLDVSEYRPKAIAA